MVAGTQAANPRQNSLALMKLSNLGQGKHGDKVRPSIFFIKDRQEEAGDVLNPSSRFGSSIHGVFAPGDQRIINQEEYAIESCQEKGERLPFKTQYWEWGC